MMVTVQGLAKATKNVFLAPWKAVLWGISWLMRLILYAGIGICMGVTLFGAVVMGHGLWHMSHPLDDPRFKGLTYWQVLEWEKMVTDRQAVAWNQAHPNARTKASWKKCVGIDFGFDIFLMYPSAAKNNLPVLFQRGFQEFLEATDRTWESWPISSYSRYAPSPHNYCLFGTLPTPEELVQAREEYQAWKKAREAIQSP